VSYYSLRYYRAPSWSWASTEGRVSFRYDIFNERLSVRSYRCSFIHCETVVKSATSPFGEVVAASLKIKAVLRQAWLIPSRGSVLWLAKDSPSLAEAETLHLANFRRENPEHVLNVEYPPKRPPYTMKGEYNVSGNWSLALIFCLSVIIMGPIVLGLLLALADYGTFRRGGSFDEGKTAGFDHLQQVEIISI
jgi:hypothetical protein